MLKCGGWTDTWAKGQMDMIVEILIYIRKYPLHRYILVVLTHTNALNRLLEGDRTLTMWF